MGPGLLAQPASSGIQTSAPTSATRAAASRPSATVTSSPTQSGPCASAGATPVTTGANDAAVTTRTAVGHDCARFAGAPARAVSATPATTAATPTTRSGPSSAAGRERRTGPALPQVSPHACPLRTSGTARAAGCGDAL